MQSLALAIMHACIQALMGHRAPGDYGPECNAFFNLTQKELAKQFDKGTELSSRCFARAFIAPRVNHPLGGAVAAVRPTDTAYFYRTKYSPICFEAW